MDVILAKDVEKLGQVGSVVKVKEGYARNFLFPQKLAYPATAGNLKIVAQKKAKRAALESKLKADAQALADKLAKVSCTVSVEVNDLEKMYGSVTETEIVKALEVEGSRSTRSRSIWNNRSPNWGCSRSPSNSTPRSWRKSVYG